jgi:hypothetical protein
MYGKARIFSIADPHPRSKTALSPAERPSPTVVESKATFERIRLVTVVTVGSLHICCASCADQAPRHVIPSLSFLDRIEA